MALPGLTWGFLWALTSPLTFQLLTEMKPSFITKPNEWGWFLQQTPCLNMISQNLVFVLWPSWSFWTPVVLHGYIYNSFVSFCDDDRHTYVLWKSDQRFSWRFLKSSTNFIYIFLSTSACFLIVSSITYYLKYSHIVTCFPMWNWSMTLIVRTVFNTGTVKE
jgi:hypothetical protein